MSARHRIAEARARAGWHSYMSGYELLRTFVMAAGAVSFPLPSTPPTWLPGRGWLDPKEEVA